MKKKLVILLAVILVFVLITYKMLSLAQVECSLCIQFNGHEQCSKALGPDNASATEEAHRNACAIIAQGVTETVACNRVSTGQLNCHPAP